MTSIDKSARKEKLKAWRDGENAKARLLYPLPDSQLEQFFALLEERRAEVGCFHDFRHSTKVFDLMGLSSDEADALLDWCHEHGGFCDCEIAANTFMHWHRTRPRA